MNKTGQDIVTLANRLGGARDELMNRLAEIDRDGEHNDRWKAAEREAAREKFDSDAAGLSGQIETLAEQFDADVADHNGRFDLDSSGLGKLAALSQLGELPAEAWASVIDGANSPAELRFVADAAERAHAAEASVKATEKAARLTAPSVGNLAGEAYFIENDPTSSATRNTAANIIEAVTSAAEAMGVTTAEQ